MACLGMSQVAGSALYFSASTTIQASSSCGSCKASSLSHSAYSNSALSSSKSSFGGFNNGLPSFGGKAVAVGRGQKGQRGSVQGTRCAVIVKESYGVAEAKGTSRSIMEDTHFIHVDSTGKAPSFFSLFDGHGGPTVAVFLQKNFWPAYKKKLTGGDVSSLTKATTLVYGELDKETIAPPKGFFGALRERGLGGSKCGSCANTAVLLPGPDGSILLVAANVGDSRTVLCRGGRAVQLSVDHKPDVEEERLRIERKNPTPKNPLVRKAGGQWRVGGLLALSRAFGDVYLKDWDDGTRDGARGGFGLTAEPSIFVETLTPDDQWLILGTDGLWDHVQNQEALDICIAAQPEKPLNALASDLLNLAKSRGSTDDISVIVVRLPQIS